MGREGEPGVVGVDIDVDVGVKVEVEVEVDVCRRCPRALIEMKESCGVPLSAQRFALGTWGCRAAGL